MKYIHKRTGEAISKRTYDILPYSAKSYYMMSDDDDGDFLTSAVIGAVTDSALLGGLLGGDIVGGIVGDLFDGDLFD